MSLRKRGLGLEEGGGGSLKRWQAAVWIRTYAPASTDASDLGNEIRPSGGNFLSSPSISSSLYINVLRTPPSERASALSGATNKPVRCWLLRTACKKRVLCESLSRLLATRPPLLGLGVCETERTRILGKTWLFFLRIDGRQREAGQSRRLASAWLLQLIISSHQSALHS